MDHKWKDLYCHFFSKVCLEQLEAYFIAEKFTKYHQTSIGGIIFKREDIFVEISYELESSPNYILRVILGLYVDFNKNLMMQSVPL